MPSEDPGVRLKRLLYRAHHRGTKEADLILGPFADAHLAGLDARELDAFEALLDLPDPSIYDWVSGQVTPPTDLGDAIISILRTIRLSARRSWTL